jgi:predicted amidophosphoribosyltransferase
LPAASFALPGERGRLVFSSSEDPIRATGTPVLTRDSSRVSMLVSSVSGVAESLFATLFPSDCRLRGAPLVNISRLPVCRRCLAGVRPITDGVCSVCGERAFSPYARDAGETRCGLCRRLEPPFVKAVACGNYDGGLRELIHLLKYEQVRLGAAVLGRMLAEAVRGLEPGWNEHPVVVVPVPLHGRKLREPGFNQSELIARHAIKLGAGAGWLALRSRVLERRRETQSQIGLTRHQRAKTSRLICGGQAGGNRRPRNSAG